MREGQFFVTRIKLTNEGSFLDSLGQLPHKLPSPPCSDISIISILPACFCYPVALKVTEQSLGPTGLLPRPCVLKVAKKISLGGSVDCKRLGREAIARSYDEKYDVSN